MSPELLAHAERKLELSDWDRDQLERLKGRAGSLESRAAIERDGTKAEQETFQRELRDLLHRVIGRSLGG